MLGLFSTSRIEEILRRISSTKNMVAHAANRNNAKNRRMKAIDEDVALIP